MRFWRSLFAHKFERKRWFAIRYFAEDLARIDALSVWRLLCNHLKYAHAEAVKKLRVYESAGGKR